MARTCAKKESAAALLFFSQQHQNNAVHNARERAEHDDRPRDDELFDAIPVMKPSACVKIDIQFFSKFFQLPPKWGRLLF